MAAHNSWRLGNLIGSPPGSLAHDSVSDRAERSCGNWCRNVKSSGATVPPRTGGTMTDIAFAPATRLASLIRRKKIGCLELLEHYVARLEKYNPAVNAVVVTDLPGARKRARAADRALATGEPW